VYKRQRGLGDVYKRQDEAIALYIRRKYNLMIGDRTAEQVKMDIGSGVVMDKELTMSVKGRDMIAGLPREVTISSTEITEALEVPLRNLTDAVRSVLEQTPPELSADIIDKGIVISGGGALLRNMDRLITTVTGVAAHVAPDPLSCVAKGTGIALEHFDVFAKSLTSHE
jgi:rod shape-determining protein MreB